jgi:Pyruvate/2-oxoacid:ferredoxin oxidoreductase gamma subunit
MEREILLTGIGGQGVQLAAGVLAHAALAEGRDVQLFGSYGGMMRGGNTDAELVVADDVIEAPPTVDSAWAVVALHPDYADPALARVRAGGLVVRNSVLWEAPLERTDVTVVEVPASDLAVEAGHVMAASMVMLGALSAFTRLVQMESLIDAVRACVPSYRQQHLQLNDRAIAAGATAVARTTPHEAWLTTPVVGSGTR